MDEKNIICCRSCRHCYKSRRSKTGYICEMWGYDDFASSVPLDGWCFKAKPLYELQTSDEWRTTDE